MDTLLNFRRAICSGSNEALYLSLSFCALVVTKFLGLGKKTNKESKTILLDVLYTLGGVWPTDINLWFYFVYYYTCLMFFSMMLWQQRNLVFDTFVEKNPDPTFVKLFHEILLNRETFHQKQICEIFQICLIISLEWALKNVT